MEQDYHHGQVIKEFRKKRGMSVAALAEQWPNGAVNPRYIAYAEAGKKQITDQDTLRQLSELLEIPLWCFGLSTYNPFNPFSLPGYGERMHQETLDIAESLIQQTWRLRQVASLPEVEKSARNLATLFDYFLTYLPPPSLLEPRFLRLHAQVQRLLGVMSVEGKQYSKAIAYYSKMKSIAEQLGDPYFLTLALMNVGVELERADHKKEAIELLEKARDISFDTSKEVAATTGGGDIQVYVVGAVKHPGVYTLPPAARVYALLQAAGGPLTKANLVALNLAAALTDGEEVYVTAIGEVPPTYMGGVPGPPGSTTSGSPTTGSPTTGQLININTASVDEMRQSLHVSSTTAQNIVNYRLQHGPYTSVLQLLQVVSKSIYNKVKDLVTV